VDDKGLNIDLVNEEINVPVSENIELVGSHVQLHGWFAESCL
jgi:hypothetical protein